MTVFTENARVSLSPRFRRRRVSIDVAHDEDRAGRVLHEGRMYARKVKACRSTAVSPRTTFLHKLSPLRTRDGATSRRVARQLVLATGINVESNDHAKTFDTIFNERKDRDNLL